MPLESHVHGLFHGACLQGIQTDDRAGKSRRSGENARRMGGKVRGAERARFAASREPAVGFEDHHSRPCDIENTPRSLTAAIFMIPCSILCTDNEQCHAPIRKASMFLGKVFVGVRDDVSCDCPHAV